MVKLKLQEIIQSLGAWTKARAVDAAVQTDHRIRVEITYILYRAPEAFARLAANSCGKVIVKTN